MANLITLGTSYYIELDNGTTLKLNYSQYRTLSDFDTGKITSEQIPQRLDYYTKQRELIICPICKKGYLPRDFIKMLKAIDGDNSCHDVILHYETAGTTGA